MRPFVRLGAAYAAALIALIGFAGCGKGTRLNLNPATPTPTAPHFGTEFRATTANAGLGAIALATGNGYLYFTEQNASKIGRLVPSSGSFFEYALTAGSAPSGITNGPDNNVWFTESGTSKIGVLTLAGSITEYATATPGALPGAIAAGGDGALWFTEPGANKIGRISTTGNTSDIAIPTANANPFSISPGPGATVWFTERNTSQIGKVTLANGTVTEYPTLTPNSQPGQIVYGSDGALWFTETGVAKLGRITTSGLVSEYSLAPAVAPTGLQQGADGNFYFTDPPNNALGVYNVASGTVKEYPLPTASSTPMFLALGADTELYVTEFTGNKIAQFIAY